MKKLGKIASVKFGRGGYQDAMFGLTLGFEFGDESTAMLDRCHYLPKDEAEAVEAGKFNEVSATIAFAERMLEVATIMESAKVDDIGRLNGIPVEVEFEGNTLKNWRVLTEVL